LISTKIHLGCSDLAGKVRQTPIGEWIQKRKGPGPEKHCRIRDRLARIIVIRKKDVKKSRKDYPSCLVASCI